MKHGPTKTSLVFNNHVDETMTYKLYYDLGSASMGVRVILEEIGAPYDIIPSTKDRSLPRSAKQMAINPNGWLPVLTWDDGAMYEAAAMAVFLCDRHPEAKLAPGINDPERGVYLQTLVYFSNSVQNAFQLNYYPDRFADTPDDEPSAQRRGIRRLHETWRVINDQIGCNEWVLGDRFSSVDIYLFMLTTWLDQSRGHPGTDLFPNVKRIADTVMARPSVQFVYKNWISDQKKRQGKK